MADKQILVGGDPAGVAVQADNTTITGNGTRARPLHAIVSGASIVHDDSLRGDGTLASPLGTDPTIPLTNGDSVPLIPGMPVAVDANVPSTVRRASATSQAIAGVVGLVTTGANPTLTCRIKALGIVHLTTAQWDAVTGNSGGLIPGANYFLGTIGTLITTRPEISGWSVTRIGYAIDTERMASDPDVPVLL